MPLFANSSHLNLISLIGLFSMLFFAWLMSSDRGRIQWRLVIIGVLFQIFLGFVFFNSQNWTIGGQFENGVLFYVFDSFFGLIKEWADAGGSFVFGAYANSPKGDDANFPGVNPLFLLKTFGFGVLPTVIFFAALMSVLYHVGIMEPVVKAMAWVMQKLLGTSGSESLAAAANVFVGHTEAPLVVKPYIAGMTRSELNAMMVGGFATITGGLMAIFVNIGVSAGHLVTASIISAPAALVIAKILQPETEKSETYGTVSVQFEKQSANVIEAAANGASDGMKLAINIAAMLIGFLALIAMLDAILFGIGEGIQYLLYGELDGNDVDLQWSLKGLFGYMFWPIAWLMGIQVNECMASGQLLGTKMVVNEFVAYLDFSEMISPAAESSNGEAAITLSERTQIIVTYALCGFSNFGAIGIQLGGIGPLAPNRKSDLAQLGLRAMLGGMLACCMTACIAGVLYGLF
ncbi:MAG: nucleoside transporter C-terminal domain-containing protein [Planctomycetota bacterium]